MPFREVDFKKANENPIRLIADEWMLLAAGNAEKFNMMTASWGFMGNMWDKSCAVTVVRPQRYTLEFIEKQDFFTLSFYGDDKKIHKICGSKSGRDIDKAAATGLTPVFSDNTVYFEQARLVLICKKLYTDVLKKENFLDQSCLRWYPEKDFHRVFVGEIVKALEQI